jgi:hypothetical protein
MQNMTAHWMYTIPSACDSNHIDETSRPPAFVYWDKGRICIGTVRKY